METRREFVKKAMLLTGAATMFGTWQETIQRAFAIDPAPGSTFLDAEHVVILMQENRSFDHMLGTLQGVRGFNDPRAIRLANGNPVWAQTNAQGETYAPFRLDIKDTCATWMSNLPHIRHSQVDAWNEGLYDHWLDAKKSDNPDYAALPLTLGHYTREDLPFYYALADAFTVCDQHFSGVMTSTMPNRTLFWSGKITDGKPGAKMRIRNEDYNFENVNWRTFPEEIMRHGVSWKFYQNDINASGGLTDAEAQWLSNFGCNPLEFFAQYKAKASPLHGIVLQDRIREQMNTIYSLTANLNSARLDHDRRALQSELASRRKTLETYQLQYRDWRKLKLADLPPETRELHARAFTTNAADSSYRKLTKVNYEAEGQPQIMQLPEGDILHQFRQDVKTGHLPTVSWLVAPENFSDHPAAPWYGAWYVSEVMAILAENPEVWKKTIFILTYDENDGYFDHMPPFVAPDPNRPETGKTSPGSNASDEYIQKAQELKHGVAKGEARSGPVGLGFRVPMFVMSPWSRGGWVNSQVFDHSSPTQFLETFLSHKTGGQVKCDNISPWRRAICGDLTSCFRQFEEAAPPPLPYLKRNQFAVAINRAQFKKIPAGFTLLKPGEIAEMNENPRGSSLLPHQDPGVRPSCALPYQLYADGALHADRQGFGLRFRAQNELLGSRAAGAAFNVYAHRLSNRDPKTLNDAPAGRMQCGTYSVAAGETMEASWPLSGFIDQAYHLSVYGPNGFFREYRGGGDDPRLMISCLYPTDSSDQRTLTGNLNVMLAPSAGAKTYVVTIVDNAYGAPVVTKEIAPAGNETVQLVLRKSYRWYDFSIKVMGFPGFEQRYAGRVENGRPGYSDPYMGRVVV